MSDYEKVLQNFINRNVLQIAILLVIAFVCITLIWLIPFVRRRMSDTHRPGRGRHSHRSRKIRFMSYVMKHDTIFVQVVLTAVCLILLVPAISCVNRIDALKWDMENAAYLTYQGKYSVAADSGSLLNGLVFDMRDITVNGRTNPVECDMKLMGLDLADESYEGTVVYGQRSGVAVLVTVDKE